MIAAEKTEMEVVGGQLKGDSCDCSWRVAAGTLALAAPRLFTRSLSVTSQPYSSQILRLEFSAALEHVAAAVGGTKTIPKKFSPRHNFPMLKLSFEGVLTRGRKGFGLTLVDEADLAQTGGIN